MVRIYVGTIPTKKKRGYGRMTIIFIYLSCLISMAEAANKIIFLICQLRIAFFFIFFLRIQTRRSISLKGKKTTKSLDIQDELYHQGWIQSTLGAHYPIQLFWQGTGQQYCLILLHKRKHINEIHLLIQGNPG